MKLEPLVPRITPVGVGFAAPHTDLYRATRRLLKDVERAEAEARDEVAALRSQGLDAAYHPTRDVELYAAAVAVFAAMTMEATIDVYRIVRFGPPAKSSGRPKGPADEYLRLLLSASLGHDVDAGERVLQIVRRTFATRNNLVHPRSFETHFDGGEIRRVPPQPEFFLEVDGDAARALAADLDAFFSEMCRLDSGATGMLMP